MLDWDNLRTFLAIARSHTLSGAARELGVRQSTMSRRLDTLEARAGVKLLQKTPSGYLLTPAGAAALGHVERMEQEALAAELTVTGRDERLEGVVRLTTVALNANRPITSRITSAHTTVATIPSTKPAVARPRPPSRPWEASIARVALRPSTIAGTEANGPQATSPRMPSTSAPTARPSVPGCAGGQGYGGSRG